MKRREISLKRAVDFHGHLGPYLVLGLTMGSYALKKLKARAHFGLEVKVWGAKFKPRSCLIDGLQLSTGCTYGKGNIQKYDGEVIRVNFLNRDTKNSLHLLLKDEIIKKLKPSATHKSSERLARKLYRLKPERIFYEQNNKFL